MDKKPMQDGYQPANGKFGYQPDNKIERGYQPSEIVNQDESINPPSGGSNVNPPVSSDKKE